MAAEVITGGKAAYRGSRLVTRLKAKSVELAAMGETQLGEEQAEVVRGCCSPGPRPRWPAARR